MQPDPHFDEAATCKYWLRDNCVSQHFSWRAIFFIAQRKDWVNPSHLFYFDIANEKSSQ